MSKAIVDADEILQHASPVVHQTGHEIQPYGHLIRMPIALAEPVCKESVEHLNQLLADTMTLRDLYKKHHWQVSGPTFHQLHLLFDKHYTEQTTLIDAIAERIQLHAHEIVLKEARTMARLASERGDDGTNDLLVSDVIRTNELHVWFVAEHVIDTPVIRAE
jgi:starvation-inducible DNA-binding protein